MYHIETEDGNIYFCSAKGKFKNEDITPVAGDKVEIEIIDKPKQIGVITKIEDRINYIKRPKMANLSQIILVVSMKLPKPDLELLDKQLVYAKYMNLKPIICLNKVDLVEKDIVKKIEETYKKIGYNVIQTNAKEKIGIEKIKDILKDNITAFSGNSGVR